MNKIKQNASLLMCLLLVGTIFAQDLKKPTVKLPTSVVGEWYNDPGNREYNGLLIHSDFIEWGYRAFIYQKIVKTNYNSYSFSAKDLLGNVINGELTIISKDTIRLKIGNSPLTTYVSRNEPKDSKRITFAEVPKMIKKQWFTTDGKNNLEFDVTTKKFSFRNKDYNIEDIISFNAGNNKDYRFIVKNNKEYRMFYFKNYSGDYLQVGFNGKMGDWYKANKTYPNIGIKNFSEYAASANGKRYLSSSKEATRVPNKVAQWIDSELAKVSTKPLADYKSSNFFNKADAKIIGYLKGYDVSLGFKTGIIYLGNALTHEDFPIVVQIHPDGRFEANLPLSAPLYSHFIIESRWIPFYIEPGQTLSVTLDLFELFKAGRMDLFENKFKNIDYKGPLATENQELLGFSFKMRDYKALRNKLKTLSPKEFKKEQLAVFKKDLIALDNYKNSTTVIQTENNLDGKTQGKATSISPKIYSVLKNKIRMQNAQKLLDYASDRKYEARSDTTNTILKLPIPTDYYDFLKDMPLDDKSLLISGEFGIFINRFEFCEPLRIYPKNRTPTTVIKPKKSILEYFDDESIEISKDERVLLTDRSDKSKEQIQKFYNENQENFKAFNEKYKEEIKSYLDKYQKPLLDSLKAQNKSKKISMEKWRLRDSVLTNVLGLDKSLAYDIVKLRALKSDIEYYNPEVANDYWKRLQKDISHPFLIEEGNRMVEKIFPKTEKTAYVLPDGKATKVFKNIIDPFKGKIVFVDFWATTCGPCVGGIKRMKETRKKYKGNKDFVFIFITDERSSPINSYTKFVQEQELENIYRLSLDDYNYLRELFKFNGIPRYVVINKEGNVINDDFPMYNFKSELSNILAKNK